MLSQNAGLVFDTILALKGVVESDAFNTMLYTGALLGFMGMIIAKSFGMKDSGGPQTFLVALFILWIGVNSKVDLVIDNTVRGEQYVVSDAPGGLAVLGWITSALGSGLRDLYALNFTSPSGGDVLSKNGVGRGLAVILGMQGVPWTDKSRDPFNGAGGYTNIEESITNFIRECYIPKLLLNDNAGGFNVFHNQGAGWNHTNSHIWGRVKSNMNLTTNMFIKSSEAGTIEMCGDAWVMIDEVIKEDTYSEIIIDDAITHMARQVAATVLAGSQANLTGGNTSGAVQTKLKAEAESIMNTLFGNPKLHANIVFLERMNDKLLKGLGSEVQGQNLDSLGRFNTALMDAQRQQQLSMAAQGDWWTRNAAPFSAILEILIYAFLPFLLLYMFISPKGLKSVLGIVGVYLWMQTWPLAHIIINYATTSMFASNIDSFMTVDAASGFGMEGVYRMWDQVRHSYAVSQSMLGLTPILTGALISGSMMMLTRLASSASGSENFDESRVSRNTESSAPIYETKASGQQILNHDGSHRQSETTDGLGTDINTTDTYSAAAKEAEVRQKAASKTVGNQILTATQRNASKMTTEQLQDVMSLDEGLQSQFKTNVSNAASVSGSKMQQLVNNVSTQFGVSADAALAIGKANKGGAAGVGAGLNISATDSEAIYKQLNESEEFKKAAEQTVNTATDFKISKSASDVRTATQGFSQSDQDSWSSSLQEMETYGKQYEEASSRATNVALSRTITEGQQWNVMGKLTSGMDKAAHSVDRGDMNDQEYAAAQHEARAEVGKQLGLSSETAELMARAQKADLWRQTARWNSGGMQQESGMLEILKKSGDNWQSFIVKNDENTHGVFDKAVDIDPQDKTGVDVENLKLDKAQVPDETNAANSKGPVKLNEKEKAEFNARKERNKNIIAGALQHKDGVIISNAEAAAKNDDKYDGNTSTNATVKSVEPNRFEITPTIEAENPALNSALGFLRDTSPLLLAMNAADQSTTVAMNTLPLAQDMHKNEQANRSINNMLGHYAIAADSINRMRENGESEDDVLLSANNQLSNILSGEDREKYRNIRDNEGLDASNAFMLEKLKSVGMAGGTESIRIIGERVTDGLSTKTDRITGENYNNKSVVGPNLIEQMGIGTKQLFNMPLSDNDVELDFIRSMDLSPEKYSDYGAQLTKNMQSEEAYNNVMADLAKQRETGEPSYSDALIAESIAVIPQIVEETDRRTIDNYQDDLANRLTMHHERGIGFLSGITSLAGKAASLDMPGGIAADRELMREVFEKHFPNIDYDEARSKIPEELRAKMEDKTFETLEKYVVENEKHLNQGQWFEGQSQNVTPTIK